MPLAIVDFQKALEHNPQMINAAFAKASCQNRCGKLEDAIDAYNEAFDLEVR